MFKGWSSKILIFQLYDLFLGLSIHGFQFFLWFLIYTHYVVLVLFLGSYYVKMCVSRIKFPLRMTKNSYRWPFFQTLLIFYVYGLYTLIKSYTLNKMWNRIQDTFNIFIYIMLFITDETWIAIYIKATQVCIKHRKKGKL